MAIKTFRYYEVMTNDDQIRFYFFETKQEAEDFKKVYDGDNPEGDCEIRTQTAEPTRRGLVKELNLLITSTCFNEG